VLSKKVIKGLAGEGEKGFALLETIIAAALLSMVFATIALYYTTTVSLWRRNNDQTEVQQQVRVVLAELVPDLQQTLSLKYRTPLDKTWRDLSAGGTCELKNGGEVSLGIPQLTAGEPILSVRYYLQGNSLIRDTGGHNPIALYIDQVQFKAPAGSEGLLEISVEAVKEGARAKMVTSAYLRNLRKGG